MYSCEICGSTLYEDQDILCSKCVSKGIREYIKAHKKLKSNRLQYCEAKK